MRFILIHFISRNPVPTLAFWQKKWFHEKIIICVIKPNTKLSIEFAASSHLFECVSVPRICTRRNICLWNCDFWTTSARWLVQSNRSENHESELHINIFARKDKFEPLSCRSILEKEWNLLIQPGNCSLIKNNFVYVVISTPPHDKYLPSAQISSGYLILFLIPYESAAGVQTLAQTRVIKWG